MNQPRGSRFKFDSKKQALLDKMLAEAKSGSRIGAVIPKRPSSQDPVPLSFAQQRLWFLDRFEGGGAGYHMPAAWRFEGDLNVEALERSINAIVARHECLRTRYVESHEGPVQIIAPALRIPLVVEDLTGLDGPRREDVLNSALRRAPEEPFDLASGPLLRFKLFALSSGEHIFLQVFHHIVFDGWSQGAFNRELGAYYEAFKDGRTPNIPELPVQCADHAVWQRQWLHGEVLERQLGYWRKQLAGAPVLDLPTDRPRPEQQTFTGSRHGLELSEELTAGLKAFNRSENVTPFMTLLSGFQVLLARYSGQKDICVGTPIANRPRVELENLIGFFANTIVLRADLSGGPDFREVAARTRRAALDAFNHQDIPFEKLVEELNPARDLSRHPLFQVMFALQNNPVAPLKLPGLKVTLHRLPVHATRFDLELHMRAEGNTWAGAFYYNTAIFDAPTISRMAEHYRTLLESMIAEPGRPVLSAPMLTLSERRQMLEQWNNTGTGYPRNRRVHELFEERAQNTPGAVAVVFGGDQITYQQLNERSSQLARHLQTLGVAPGVITAICVDRSIEMVVGLLGIWKAGGAYLPLDPDFPRERLEFMLADSAAQVLLTQQSLGGALPAHKGIIVNLDSDWPVIATQECGNLPGPGDAANIAYVLYTSGSTGKPKGVRIQHRALVNFLSSMRDKPGLSAGDTLLAVTTLSFDIAGLELWLPLTVGARAVVASRKTAQNAEELARLASQCGATVMQATPTTWQLLLSAGWKGGPGLKILCGGEAWTSALAERLLPHCGSLWNMYGPTETTIWSSALEIRQGRPVVVGPPIANTQFYVLDENLQPCPAGVPGELWIGGDGLAADYLNRPELTAEKFHPNPFTSRPGARVYRTGDSVRWKANGTIEFLGRMDNQVKIRGFRIELGEIEALLAEYPDVEEAAVVATDGDSANQRLVAYLTARQETAELEDAAAGNTRISDWQAIWDDTYSEAKGPAPASLNLLGWKSSYDGRPIPAPEMEEWIHQTVARIMELRPKRVLELGCGTGLLLLRIAPHCERYCGVDFSAEALESVRRKAVGLNGVTLLQRRADELEDLGDEGFDLVILNSVAQYFPTLHYLTQVLNRASKIVIPGGRIFIGDVRNYRLLEAFCASVQLYQAPDSLTAAELARRIRKQTSLENELLIAPEFFSDPERLPGVSERRIQLRRGRLRNEMTLFRYDVVIGTGAEPPTVEEVEELDWGRENLSVSALQAFLEMTRPACLRVVGIPNARLRREFEVLAGLGGAEPGAQILALRESVEKTVSKDPGIEPEDLWRLGELLPYEVTVDWSDPSQPGACDATFTRKDADKARIGAASRKMARAPSHKLSGPWANIPLLGDRARKLIPNLRDFLKNKIPSYMAPAEYVVLESMPLTPNGKIDRKALPAPDRPLAAAAPAHAKPHNATEEALAAIWAQTLGLPSVGIHDNFFELGGHSLLTLPLQKEVQEMLGVKLPLAAFFQNPTVAGLAGLITGSNPATQASGVLTLDSKGGRPPLFCLHFMSSAQHLARFLGDERKIYGVESPIDDEINRWRANSEAPIGMEELAARYVQIIQGLEPRGPYHLAGYCFGGVLAFEVCRQLQRKGEHVGALVLLDAIYTPGCRRLWLGGVRRWLYHASQFPKKGPGYVAAKLRKQIAKTKRGFSRAVTSGAVLLTRREADTERMRWQYSQSLSNILSAYAAGQYTGDALLFRTVAEPNSWDVDVGEANGWAAVISGKLERKDIRCTHKELFEEPAFIEVAMEMRRYLERIDTQKVEPSL